MQSRIKQDDVMLKKKEKKKQASVGYVLLTKPSYAEASSMKPSLRTLFDTTAAVQVMLEILYL